MIPAQWERVRRIGLAPIHVSILAGMDEETAERTLDQLEESLVEAHMAKVKEREDP